MTINRFISMIHKTIFVIIFTTASLLFPLSNHAQITLGNTTPIENIQTVPDIQNLNIHWWDYFSKTENRDESKELTHVFITALNDFLQQSEDKILFQSNVDEIKELLNQYQKQKFAKSKTSKPHEYKLLKQYSITDLININIELREKNLLREKNNLEKESLIFKINNSKKVINQLILRYSNQSSDLIEKNKTALIWIEERIKQALDNIKLKHTISRIDKLSQGIENEKIYLSEASRKLVIDSDREKLDPDISDHKKLSKIKQKIRTLNLKLAKNFTDTEESFIANEIDKLELIQQLIEESKYQLSQMKSKQIFMLSQILSKYVDIGNIRDVIKESNTLSKKIGNSIIDWQIIAQNALLNSTQIRKNSSNRKIIALIKKRKSKIQSIITEYEKLRNLNGDNNFITHLLEQKLTQLETGISRTWNNIKDFIVNAKNNTVEIIHKPLFNINGNPVTLMPLINLIIIILIGYIFSKVVTFFISRYEKRNKIDKINNRSSLYLMHRLIHYFIIFLVVLAGFSTLGINLSNITLIAGALSVGIGFGLQNLVSNFVSGLTIMFEKTLSIGDYIELEDGTTGTVKEIKARSTRINTNDNIDVIIPNSDMVTNIITNWTLKESIRRVKIPFGIAYGTDKELVKKAAIEAASNVQFTLHNIQGKEPDVWIVEFGDSSVNYELLVWVAHYGLRRPNRIKNLYLWELDTALRKYGIEIPFPQRDVHLNIVDSKKQTISTLIDPDAKLNDEENNPQE